VSLLFENFQLTNESTSVTIPFWEIKKGESWTLFNYSGDVGPLMTSLLKGEVLPNQGSLRGIPPVVSAVSLRGQQLLLEEEIKRDESDYLDQVDPGTSVVDLIRRGGVEEKKLGSILRDLDLIHLKDRGFRLLSTGESRRVMLAMALAESPDLLILDEPFSGLDQHHHGDLQSLLENLSSSIPLILILSRLDEVPQWVSGVALFEQGALVDLLNTRQWHSHGVMEVLKKQEGPISGEVLSLYKKHRHKSPQGMSPVFAIKKGCVTYREGIVFSEVNWCIEPGESWQIIGPNGCGKSTLLGLISGDHPQCYSNDIVVFGRQRGTGETLWEIKEGIGLVTSSLHLQYRADCTLLEAVISGFYDSIGLYHQPLPEEIRKAREWLRILHLEGWEGGNFRTLTYGQQRLVLIARALVKGPELLILDEPFQGLNFLERRLIHNTLEALIEHGLSQMIFVSHYEEDRVRGIDNLLRFYYDSQTQGYKASVESKS